MPEKRSLLFAALLCILTCSYGMAQTTSCPPPSTPGVNICSPPRSSTTTTPVHVVASATGNGGIRYMQIYLNTVKYATYHGTDHIDVQINTDRSVSIVVLAKDNTGQNYTSFASASIYGSTTGCDTTEAGTVKICSPWDGPKAASAPQQFRVVAVAASAAGIKYLQVYINGMKYATYYTDHLDTLVSVATTGGTRVTVQAKDNLGATFKSTVFPNVQNVQ